MRNINTAGIVVSIEEKTYAATGSAVVLIHPMGGRPFQTITITERLEAGEHSAFLPGETISITIEPLTGDAPGAEDEDP